ncbi:MAG: ThuA domain-containing protein [Phycisphaerales bacterium]
MKAPGEKDFAVLDATKLRTPAPEGATSAGVKQFTAPALGLPVVMVFSKTAGFRHDSIPDGIAMIKALGDSNGFEVVATEDSGLFTDENLGRCACVVFLSTTGDVLNPEQQGAFERYIGKGRGYVGVHAASDTEYDWPFYGELVGAYFKQHPAIQDADISVVEPRHVTTEHLPAVWRRKDEWYCFREAPRAGVHRVLMLNEASYQGGTMKGDHPVAWWHEFKGSRVFYTALGHTKESYTEPEFVEHVRRAIVWSGAIRASVE